MNYNSGYYNSGDYNSGYYNSGHRNSGYYNSGHRNSGYYNSGDYNSGNYNSGHRNSGNCNSGYYNSGNYNSGHCNSGHCNSGYYNSGDCNSGDYNSGFFNTDEPTVRMFNKDTGLKRDEIEIPHINLLLTEWVSESKMTDKQKEKDPDYKTKGGTLITRTYHEAWAKAWNELDRETRDKFLDLPNFDAEIFKEITGIDVSNKASQVSDCSDKVVEIEGKKYKLVPTEDGE